MTPQAGARAVLSGIRRRQQPANDMLDSVLTITQPSDIRAELDQLKASYQIVNQQAQGRPEWDAHFAEFLKFYDETRPRTEGIGGWFQTSTATLNNIRNRAARLEEWKAILRGQKVNVGEPEKKLPPPEGGSAQQVAKWGLYALGGLLVFKLVSK